MSNKNRISGLGLELIELSHALESVRLVSDCDRTRSFADAADARAAPRAVSATVGLVSQRLRALAAALSVNDEGAEEDAPAPARPRRRSTK
jgi:hypothetical protein